MGAEHLVLPELVSTGVAARILCTSEQTVRVMEKRGDLRAAVKLENGNRRLFLKSDVEALAFSRAQKAAADRGEVF